MREIEVSIVIPAYNAQQGIARTVEACLKQELPFPCETIVVDDGSTDDTAARVRAWPVRYLYQENAGPAKARNNGWKAASGGIVCFTDSDCIPRPNWVSALLDGFESDDIAAVAGSYDIGNQESFLARCIHLEIKDRHAKFGREIRAFGSYNVAIRRTVLERTGGFNESYRFPSGEDNDLSYRILKAGYRIAFRGNALVAHRHQERLGHYLAEQFRHGAWRMKLYRDFPDRARGDDYTAWKDVVEPPLTLLLLISVLFLWNRYGVIAFFILAASVGLLQIPAAKRVVKKERNLKFICLAGITFLRAFARGLGMGQGIWRFWLSKPW